jgi:phosphatidylglycerophosphatase C
MVAPAIQKLTTAQLIPRIEAAMRGKQHAIVATDADGTLWSGDVGIDVFEALVSERAIRHEALDALAAEARAFGVDGSTDPNQLASRLNDACLKGVYPEQRAYEMMAWVFAGFTDNEVRGLADKVLTARALGARLHPEMTRLVLWALNSGACLRVVSASPLQVVQQSVARIGIAADCVIAATAACENAKIQPRMAEPIPFGLGKVRALQRATPGATLVAAFGDNSFDVEMMKQSAVAIAVRPKPRLLERASELPDLIELIAE